MWITSGGILFSFIAKSVQLHLQVQRKENQAVKLNNTRPGHTINDYSVSRIVKSENQPQDPMERPREFEGYWMIKLNTLEPYGLNGINEYERIIKKRGLKVMFDEEISSES